MLFPLPGAPYPVRVGWPAALGHICSLGTMSHSHLNWTQINQSPELGPPLRQSLNIILVAFSLPVGTMVPWAKKEFKQGSRLCFRSAALHEVGTGPQD